MNRYPLAAASLAFVFALGLAGPAVSTEDPPGWVGYGQLNFGVMGLDDGATHRSFFAENPHVPSRVGATFSTELQGGATVSFNIESGFGFTGLDDVSALSDGFDMDLDRKVLRKFELIYDTSGSGTVSLGQGSMASDGAAGVDLSGTALAHGASVGDLGGSALFVLADGTPSNVMVGDVFDDLSGLRRFRVRYDTPVWRGLSASGAYGREILRRNNNSNYRDVALNYATQTGYLIFEAVMSYEWIGGTTERAVASASALHEPTGLSATLATGANRNGPGTYDYAKLGFKRPIAGLGSLAVAVEFYDGENFGFAGSRSRATGLGVVQNLERLDLDVFASLRRYELSGPATSFRSIHVTMVGARWTF
jgi:hypothetical protein